MIKVTDTHRSRAIRAHSYVNNLLDSNNNTPWCILGGTSPWNNEANPPFLSQGKGKILDAEVCVPVTSIRFIYPSATGLFSMDSINYAFCENNISSIIKLKAYTVLFQIKIDLSNIVLPYSLYRQGAITNSINFISIPSTNYSLISNVRSYNIDTLLSFSPINLQETQTLNIIKVF